MKSACIRLHSAFCERTRITWRGWACLSPETNTIAHAGDVMRSCKKLQNKVRPLHWVPDVLIRSADQWRSYFGPRRVMRSIVKVWNFMDLSPFHSSFRLVKECPFSPLEIAPPDVTEICLMYDDRQKGRCLHVFGNGKDPGAEKDTQCSFSNGTAKLSNFSMVAMKETFRHSTLEKLLASLLSFRNSVYVMDVLSLLVTHRMRTDSWSHCRVLLLFSWWSACKRYLPSSGSNRRDASGTDVPVTLSLFYTGAMVSVPLT